MCEPLESHKNCEQLTLEMPISLMTYWWPSFLDFTRMAFPKEPSPIFFTFSYLSMSGLSSHAVATAHGIKRQEMAHFYFNLVYSNHDASFAPGCTLQPCVGFLQVLQFPWRLLPPHKKKQQPTSWGVTLAFPMHYKNRSGKVGTFQRRHQYAK